MLHLVVGYLGNYDVLVGVDSDYSVLCAKLMVCLI